MRGWLLVLAVAGGAHGLPENCTDPAAVFRMRAEDARTAQCQGRWKGNRMQKEPECIWMEGRAPFPGMIYRRVSAMHAKRETICLCGNHAHPPSYVWAWPDPEDRVTDGHALARRALGPLPRWQVSLITEQFRCVCE